MERHLELRLKLLSDVAIVGAPNSGKSTLLTALSNAKPKIAPYPFTTLSPKIGIANVTDTGRLIISEVPGLIEGASKGRGMGNMFLSHVERSKVLLLLIDGSERRQIKRTYTMLIRELREYNEDLLNKKRVVAINKIDTWKVIRKKELTKFFKEQGEEVFFISALRKTGLTELCERLYVLSLMYKEKKIKEKVVITMEKEETPDILRIVRIDENTLRVSQKELERRVELSDVKRYRSLKELRNYFDKIDLEKQLKQAGIKEGDRVIIGAKSFIYKEDE